MLDLFYNLQGHPDTFLLAGKEPALLRSSLKYLTVVEGVFAMIELLALAGVHSLVLAAPPPPKKEKKTDRDKTRNGIFALGRSELSAVRQILHLVVGNWFSMNYVGNAASFPEVYVTNTLMLYLLQ